MLLIKSSKVPTPSILLFLQRQSKPVAPRIDFMVKQGLPVLLCGIRQII